MIRFKSILNPSQYGFVYESSDTEHWDACYRASGLLSYRSFYYETFGDNGIQHSPLRPVAGEAIMLDWLLSFAQHLIDHPEDYEYSIDSLFGYSLCSRDLAEFLASVKEPKDNDATIYYSIQERKVSKSDTKRHDKRWFTLPASAFQYGYELDRIAHLWHNGQESRMLKLIETIGLYLELGDGLNRTASFCASDVFAKLTNEDIFQAARVLWELIRSMQWLTGAKRSVECVIGNHKRALNLAA